MTSEAQVKANRQNAQRSTGANTPRGKAVARRNAVRHGFEAKDVVIPGEDAEAFDAFRHDLYRQLAPEGALEGALVERIVSALWRLRRAGLVEAGLFQLQQARSARETVRYGEYDLAPALVEGVRKESGDEAARTFEVELRAADAAFEREGPKLAQTLENIAERGDPLAKLGRYEERLEGTLYRALQELRRVQHKRGQTVTVEAIDVSQSD